MTIDFSLLVYKKLLACDTAEVMWGGTPVLSLLVQGVYELISVQEWPCWHTQNTCRVQDGYKLAS